MSTLLLQISDTHFGTERLPVVAALERLAQALRPDVLLLSGDITQRATPAQFSAARAFVERLRVPAVLAIPGNHDISLFNPLARLLWPYRRYSQAFGSELEPQFENAEALVLALNTTRWWRHKHGELSEGQIERVAQRLQAASPGQCRIVMVHQPLAVTQASDLNNRLRGHQAALRRWAEAGLDLIVGGHIHLPFVLPLQPQQTGLARPLWAVQAGTAVSARLRPGAGNSVNVIRLPQRVVERWDFDEGTLRFEQVRIDPVG
ncbi:metallophosphoesterase family protein [Paucibacter sp. XJ19-41]|uniref:metallophosphoesterase family protein n=1 Tax=Paucibacter sp. XJ19-41 TaxID=2927824 RepID=UPI00234A8D61|nr:metallophosphoesterase [Paucibacter sp. XJ19-41]MDC6165818.1 metallophosphoesterase [Paucibacter sp. XJ19-41]